MKLSAGTRLGPYEIVAPLGAGGMGEVYRARDTRLDRVVAIKVLPSHLNNSPEMQQRFEREARAVSSLSHSNICTLFDVGRQDGIDYLVMEYVDGESLADRLSKGPLPMDQVLRYAIQIADALDRAHRQGIIHRDLKPGNIMLAKSGAKLLDFGLAKLQDNAAGSVFSGLSNVATERVSLTGEGTILGTFQYMAPEQLEGQEADPRTDIFAFGTVVYEMATAKKAFTGKSQASLIGAILRDEPPTISTSQSMSPPALDRVVKTCLAKDPDDRWQSARDLAQELKWIAEGGSQSGTPVAALIRSKLRDRIPWIVAGVFFLTAVTFAVLYATRSAPLDSRILRFNVPPPEKVSFGDSSAISPDGRLLVFAGTDADGKSSLWVRAVDNISPKLLDGTDGAEFPFWSPDSRSIGFFAENKLKKIDASGGRPQTLCDVTGSPRGGAWSSDGTIIFTPDYTTPLYKISAGGGTPTPITEFDVSRNENSHRWPCFLSDGRRFLYFSRGAGDEGRAIVVGSLDSTDRKIVIDGDSRAILAYDRKTHSDLGSYLLFVRNRVLMAQAFDERNLRVFGDALPLADDIQLFGESGPTGYAAFSVSTDGVLAYRSGLSSVVQFMWVDRSSRQLTPVGAPGLYTEPSLSPDEKRVMFDRTESQPNSVDLWSLDLARSTTSRFTFNPGQDVCSVWSPDGSRIVFSSNRNGQMDLYQKNSSGTGNEELLLNTDVELFADDWSLDGRYLLYESNDPKTKFDLWLLPMVGDRKPVPFLQTQFNEAHAQFSPEGRWVAYASDESGRAEVYVQAVGASGGKWQISTGGGDQPRWRRDGKELFYLSPARQLMSVPIISGAAFEAGIPVQMFELFVPSKSLTGDRNDYVVADNGRKFLVCNFVDRERARPITLVSNWMAALNRK